MASVHFWSIVLAGGVALSTPILLAALGETIGELSGVLNLGIEGTMLMGALAGVWGSHLAGSGVGVLVGIAVGTILGGVMALAVVVARANQIVVGLAITLAGSGFSSYLFQVWVPSGQTTVVAPLTPVVEVPTLDKFPLIGQAIFHQNVLTYVAAVLVVCVSLFLSRTKAGLAVRACGDDPRAAKIRGVATGRVQAMTAVGAGAFAGLAGASITVGYLGSFTQNVTDGEGFVALAVVIIGGWSAGRCVAGALLFGFFSSLGLQAQNGGVGLPVEFYTALPYVMTLVVLLAGSSGRRAPRALALPLPEVT